MATATAYFRFIIFAQLKCRKNISEGWYYAYGFHLIQLVPNVGTVN